MHLPSARRHHRWGITELLVTLLLLWPAMSVEAEVIRAVRATGFGVLIDDDVAAAFAQAKNAALRAAVEQSLGTLISSHTKVRNFAVIEDHILSQTAGYVREFSIVEQGKVDTGTYQVVIDASVSLGELYRQLDAVDLLIEVAGSPRLVCIGRERLKEGGELRALSWDFAAGEVVDRLQDYSDRFTVSTLQPPIPQDYSAREESARLQGDLVIAVDVTVEAVRGIKIPLAVSSRGDLGIQSAVAHTTLTVSWSDSGENVAVLDGVRKAADSTLDAAARKAVRLGLQDMRDQLVKRIVDDWRKKAYSGRLLALEIVGDPTQVGAFEREFPLRIGGIERLYPRSVSGGVARYDAQSKSAGFQIARELSAKGLEGIDLEIVEVSLNAMRLKLQ